MSKPKITQVIGFIGAGNMARSIAGGLLANDWPKDKIILSDPDPAQQQATKQALGTTVYASNDELVNHANILVLAVKPQILAQVSKDISGLIAKNKPLIISIAAGIRVSDLARWLGNDIAIVRAMPNTPALVGAGACGLFANNNANEQQREEAETIMRATGVTVWVQDEKMMDVITALSGSGPAYFLLVMEAMESAAISSGLDRDAARLLTMETALGAAKMALESGEEPGNLRNRVTSPGGTTEAALKVLEEGRIVTIFQEAIKAATARSGELAELFGKSNEGN